MKILVTGFEPFGGETVNPAAQVVEALPHTIGGAALVKRILPVALGACDEALAAAVGTHRPGAILSIGQAGGRAAVTVERVGVNLDDFPIPDNGGNQPKNQPIDPRGPDAYLTDLPVAEMVEAIRARGVPAGVSMTAGTFLCNHVLYLARRLCEREGLACPCGFLHIPFLPQQVTDKPGQPSMPLELSLKAVTAALEVIAR